MATVSNLYRYQIPYNDQILYFYIFDDDSVYLADTLELVDAVDTRYDPYYLREDAVLIEPFRINSRGSEIIAVEIGNDPIFFQFTDDGKLLLPIGTPINIDGLLGEITSIRVFNLPLASVKHYTSQLESLRSFDLANSQLYDKIIDILRS